ncbi:hypothetical protein [Roseovarius bejariae]|nr:hypothetical protein [Roseovarius bejariae]
MVAFSGILGCADVTGALKKAKHGIDPVRDVLPRAQNEGTDPWLT